MDEPVLSWGAPHAERADAARNRRHLLATAREMLAEQGPDTLTMDGLAERAGLGKGTVFRRFGTRAGIFAALLDDDEKAFQQQVLAGPPPLGPGAAPLDRLIAYGRARTRFLITHRDIARAALDGHQPIPAGSQTPLSQVHIRILLGQMDLGGADLDMLAVQLTAALTAPCCSTSPRPTSPPPPRPPNGSRTAGRTTVQRASADLDPCHQATAGTIVHLDFPYGSDTPWPPRAHATRKRRFAFSVWLRCVTAAGAGHRGLPAELVVMSGCCAGRPRSRG